MVCAHIGPCMQTVVGETGDQYAGSSTYCRSGSTGSTRASWTLQAEYPTLWTGGPHIIRGIINITDRWATYYMV